MRDLPRRLLGSPSGRAATAGLLLCATLGGAGYWWMVSRWKPPPSIFDTPVDDVMGYLAIDDFSQLPVEERMRFLMQFAERFRGLQQSESAVLAGFLAGLSGPAREQMRQNARILAKDVLKQGAEEYLALKTDEERGAYIDQWLLKWMKQGEMMVGGEERDRSDGQRLADVKEDARKGRQRAAADAGPDVQMKQEDVVSMMNFWASDVEQASTPKEQGQIIRFMRDVRNHVMK